VASQHDAAAEPARHELNSRVGALIGTTAAAAGAALALTGGLAVHELTAAPARSLEFLVLSLALQMTSVPIPVSGRISVSAIGILVSGFVLGPGAAMTFALLAAIFQWITSRGLLHRAIFDVSQFVLSAGAGAGVYRLFVDALPSRAGALAGAAVAGVVYSAVNNGLLCTAMGLSEGESIRHVWRERFSWARFHYLAFGPVAYASASGYEAIGIVGLVAFMLPSALLLLSVRQYLDRTRDAVEEVRAANARLARQNVELQQLTDRLRRTHLATIAALSRSMEAKDFHAGGHTVRVATIALGLGRRLGYTGDDLSAIEVGGILHDIGKIGVPESILRKPHALTDEEWAVVREHPLVSDRILAEIDLPLIVRQIARSSHERIDGTGYPDGLAGEDIPLPARIVHVADAFDALTTDRPYRRRRPTIVALEEIRAHAGTQFCPMVVEALERLYAEEPQILTAGFLTAVA
jgi:hypothetical protein